MQATTRFFEVVSTVALAVGLLTGGTTTQASDDSEGKRSRPPGGELQTQDGKIYRDVWVDKVDPDGVFFFHRDGAAKILFTELTPRFQKVFSFDPAAVAEVRSPVGRAPEKEKTGTTPAIPPMILTYRIRTTFPTQVSAPVIWAPYGCGTTPARRSWPSHWSRFHSAHAYAYFGARQLAERDFLTTTGIIPSPVGVRRWRLR